MGSGTRRLHDSAGLGLFLLASRIILADSNSDSLDEIVVTARKIVEPLSVVPISLQVITREELRRTGIDGLQSLSGQVPGLYVEPMWGGGNAAPTIRGQSHPAAPGSTVGVFLDGILQFNDAGDDAAMFDLERIEVAKGPQGAMYGDTTFAGAINLVTRRPTNTLEREISLSSGTDAYRGVSAAVSGPLGPRGLLGRVSFQYREFDGTGKNLANPRDNLGGYRKWGTALSLEYSPSTRWHLTGTLRLTNDRSEQPAASQLTGPDYNCGSRDPITGNWSYYCGNLPRAREFDISANIPDSDTQVLQSSVHVQRQGETWDFDAVTSYYRSNSDIFRDWDSTSAGERLGVCTIGINCDPAPGVSATVNRIVAVNQVLRAQDTTEGISQEFRVRFHRGRFKWMLGAQTTYLYDRAGDALGVGPVALAENERLTALLPATPLKVGPLSVLNDSIVADANATEVTNFNRGQDTYNEVFGALDVDLTHRLNGHAEIRSGLGTYNVKTPRVSIDFGFNPKGLVWLSVAKGENPGGSNDDPTLIPSERKFGPESGWTYEFGLRDALLKGRLKVDAAVFYIDWRDAQVPGPSNTPGNDGFIIRNIKGMRTRGIEMSADYKLLAGWSFAGGFSYVDPRFKSGSEDVGDRKFCGLSATNSTSNFCTIGPSRVLTQGAPLLVPYIDGNVVQRAPQNQWTAALTYEPRPTATGLSWFIRTGLEHQGRVFVRPIDGGYNGGRTLVNARVGLARGVWSVDIWATNITDVNYIRAVAGRGNIFFPTTRRPHDLIYGDAKRFGLDVRWTF